MKPKFHTAKLRNTNLGASLVTAITVCFGSVASVSATTWLTTGTTAWNTNANWGGGLGIGVTYKIQGSDQLAIWDLAVSEVLGADKTAIETGLPALNSGWTYRTFQSPGAISGDPRDFLRAVIVNP